ncbi:axin-2-like, partial [Hyla sarda]|uniref:axin-2-like n=1 Tax=Hyla sarda TaxID=327740 RepID=UPI0024C2E416
WYTQNDLISPCHVTTGYVFAPTTSANESEISSDAVTYSSVDGFPPYRSNNKKAAAEEMHCSVRANGQVALPHFPRTHRLPREMTPVEPAAFAAELIGRLEKVKQEQETMHTLEERLQQIKEEEDREECETPIYFQTPRDSMASCDDDPQAILDEHLSRVLKTPGCQSPQVVGRSRSPERSRILRPTAVVQSVRCSVPTKSKHVHHHYIHHHTVPRTMEEMEATCQVRCLYSSPADYCCYLKTRTPCLDLPLLHMDAMGRKVIPDRSGEGGVVYQMPIEESWQRVLESERLSKHHSAQNTWRNAACEPTRASSAERPSRHHQGSAPIRCQHPPGLDTTVVSVSTLAQLEEACRRLAGVSRPRL